ncbi:hypothetical protein SuNHUV7_27530 (plasmid) [Pseudoseohaeicola sp. NH-UV-7]|uniref:hypothetical protein n=1 Tax=Sulfitobacter sp. TBRI5 TaxID=2989732 RepID=UPI003A7A6925
MNEVTVVKSLWVAPTQIPILGSFWLWRYDRLVAAGGQLQALQRNVQHNETGMIGGDSRESRNVFVVTHLLDEDMTSQREAVRALSNFNWDVWSSLRSIMLAIGPAQPERLNGTRNAVAAASEEKVDLFSHRRYRPMLAYQGIDHPYGTVEINRRPTDQYPCSFHAGEVSGILTEPRDDPRSPARYKVAPDLPLLPVLRAELDGIIDAPSADIADLPQLAACVGTLSSIMHSRRWAPEPLLRRSGDDADWDGLYDEITTHRY